MKIRTFTLCINARGAAEIVETVVNCTPEEHDLGMHYDFAEKAAEKDGYEPVKSFDENEPAGKVAIRGAQATDEPEVVANLLECMKQAQKSGDWKVDGACDPDAAIYRAERFLRLRAGVQDEGSSSHP